MNMSPNGISTIVTLRRFVKNFKNNQELKPLDDDLRIV